MPFSFIEIEEKKNRIIGFLLVFIVFFYFLTAYLVLFALQNAFYMYFSASREAGISWPSLPHVLIIFTIASIAALIHWTLSTNHLIERMSSVLGAEPLDEEDIYHQYLKNIVDEVSVAIGGRTIEPKVISSVSMNAFALEDFNRRAVIGVTEGLLTRLGRSQIEAVVAHEAGHIVSGDCLSTTVTCALAEIYEETLSKISLVLKETRGRGTAPFVIVYLVVGFMHWMSTFMRYFISRQREYRADAISTRLTRDPLSLAEALMLISKNWRGEGADGDRMQSVFIVNPVRNGLDEAQGLFADIFSTHPPVAKRVSILADMAHLDEKTLEENLKNFKRVSPVALGEYEVQDRSEEKRWLVFLNQTWTGPYFLLPALLRKAKRLGLRKSPKIGDKKSSPKAIFLNELKKMDNFKPEQWVRCENEKVVRHAYEDKDLMSIFNQDKGAQYLCPNCHVALSEIIYEGAPILKCHYCDGLFVEYAKVSRILIRPDKEFDDQTKRLAEIILQQKKDLYAPRPTNRSPKGADRIRSLGHSAQGTIGGFSAEGGSASGGSPGGLHLGADNYKGKNAWIVSCPKCARKMHRQFFVYSYPIEIDRCPYCGGVWFDWQELEVLQYLYEHKEQFFAA